MDKIVQFLPYILVLSSAAAMASAESLAKPDRQLADGDDITYTAERPAYIHFENTSVLLL